jgi:radical SAM protein with 4Fe4S-binding SPASM domain
MKTNNSLCTINELHFNINSHSKICAHNDIGSDNQELSSLWIEIPDFCHLQCSYCFASTKRNSPRIAKDHLLDKEYIKLIEDFSLLGGKFLGIPGNGEPFHPKNRKLVLKILRKATELKIPTTVFTTGDSIFYNIDDPKKYQDAISTEPDFSLMDELAQLDIILLIKCNSLVPKIQNTIVAQNGYTETRAKAIDFLINRYSFNNHGSDKKQRLGIVTSILPENKDEILKLYHFAKDNNLIFDCDTILPRGRGITWKEKSNLIDLDYKAVYNNLSKESNESMSSGGSYVGVACDRVFHHLYIDIKGNAYPCIGCVDRDENADPQKILLLGNIRNESLKKIWNNVIRKQLRENLPSIIIGPCSYCKNFNKTCFTCLGRIVDKFECNEGRLALHTKGCFNHSPDTEKWLERITEYLRAIISEIPSDNKDSVREKLYEHGMEFFWQCIPQKIQNQIGKTNNIKDFSCNSLMHFSPKDIWDMLEYHPWKKNITNINIDTEANSNIDSLKELLPKIILPSILLVIKDFDKTFIPKSKNLDDCDLGLVQFINLMFFMNSKKRYFYRTISCNSFDYNLPVKYSSELSESLKIRNRESLIIQRWAETFIEGEPAPILPYIANLSQELENERVDIYDLILSTPTNNEKLEKEFFDIDHEIRYQSENILIISPLLSEEHLLERTSQIYNTIHPIASDDTKWEKYCSSISNMIFVDHPDDVSIKNLKDLYKLLAANSFYLEQEIDSETSESIRDAIISTIVYNIVLPTNNNYSKYEDLLEKFKNLNNTNWQKLIKWLCYDRNYDILNNRDSIIYYLIGEDTTLRDRFLNPILCQFVKLFFNNEGKLTNNWHLALNYFIWLCFFKKYLNIHSYFVLHSPNLQLQCKTFIGQNNSTSTPNGLIICGSERFPIRMRKRLKSIFSLVMDPIDEIINAIESYHEGYFSILHTIKNQLTQEIIGRLEPKYWINEGNYLKTSDRRRLERAIEHLKRIHHVIDALYYINPNKKIRPNKTYTLNELCDIFNKKLEYTKELFGTDLYQNLSYIPPADLQITNINNKYETNQDIFEYICIEVLLNISKHADFSYGTPIIQLSESKDEKYAELIIINYTKINESLKAFKQQYKLDISGNSAIRVCQMALGLPTYTAGKLHENESFDEIDQIKIVVPIARKIN